MLGGPLERSGFPPPSGDADRRSVVYFCSAVLTALCRREGLAPNLYYRWSKACLEAGKKRLLGDTTREATSTEVQDLRREHSQLKQVVAKAWRQISITARIAWAEAVRENRVLKKNLVVSGAGDDTCD